MSLSDAHAVIVVDWGGNNYVTGDESLAGDTGGADGVQGGFSGGDPLPLNPSSGYSTSASSGAFYGTVTWTTVGQDGGYGEVTNGANDQIELKRYDTYIQGLFLWKRDDFLNNPDMASVTFDDTSSATVYLDTLVGFTDGHIVLRKEGANAGYYISQEQPIDNDDVTLNFGFTGLTWLAYDPATSLDTFGAAVDIYEDGVINNITEIGFYTNSNASSPNAFRLRNFQIDAALVPEPNSLGMISLSVISLLGLRRRLTARS